MLTGNTCKYSIAGSVMEGGVASTLYAGSLKHSGLFTCVMVIRMNASARCGCFVVILLSAKRHQHSDSIFNLVDKIKFRRHTLHIVAKSTIGSETPEWLQATNDAPASFLLSASLHAELWWAGQGNRKVRRFPVTPVVSTLSSPPPARLRPPVVELFHCYRRLP